MTPDDKALAAAAHRLFTSVMAPLVLGGELRPGRILGMRRARALGREPPLVGEAGGGDERARRVYAGRLARARRLAPINRLESSATGPEWTLAAALHDVLQAANPRFEAPLRRAAARRVLELALATIEDVPAPATVRDALSRHSWFARLFDIARTDTTVSWWTGGGVFLGVDPPPRLRAWPSLRRVRVTTARRPLLDLAPLAFDRDAFVETVARALSRTPVTDLATCARPQPTFAWTDSTLALLGTRAGMTLALRALARQPAERVDQALGRTTRELYAEKRDAVAGPALAVLAERALAAAQSPPGLLERAHDAEAHASADAELARALGAVVAADQLASRPAWSDRDRSALLASLEPFVRSEAGRAAVALVRGSAPSLAQAGPA